MFPERLKQMRQQHAMTQSELGVELNLSRGAIGMYEAGKRKPDYDLLLTIAHKYDVSVDWLLGRPVSTREDIADLVRGLSDQSLRELKEYIQYLKSKDTVLYTAAQLAKLEGKE